MAPAPTVLLVHADAAVRTRWATLVSGAGYATAVASSFDEGKAALAQQAAPALLVTGVRLGAYHGMHLILRCRMDHPGTATLLVSDAHDPVIEAEAARHGVAYLADAGRDDLFVTKVASLLAGTAL